MLSTCDNFDWCIGSNMAAELIPSIFEAVACKCAELVGLELVFVNIVLKPLVDSNDSFDWRLF